MITSTANAKVKHIRRLQTEKRYRWRERQFVVEGTRWLTELLDASSPAILVMVTEEWLASAVNNRILQQVACPYQLVHPDVMAAMSNTETPSGVLAVVEMRPRPLPPNPTCLLILDAVTNPGNLGTMLRTAGAACVDGVLLGPGCVDPTNPKVVRGSMGALLRLPVHVLDWDELATAVAGMAVRVATVDGEVRYTAVDWRQPSALIIGSEAHGASQQARELATGSITIPMCNTLESLNAAMAAGVVLFEAARQRFDW